MIFDKPLSFTKFWQCCNGSTFNRHQSFLFIPVQLHDHKTTSEVLKLLKSPSSTPTSKAQRTMARCAPIPGIFSSNSLTLLTLRTSYVFSLATASKSASATAISNFDLFLKTSSMVSTEAQFLEQWLQLFCRRLVLPLIQNFNDMVPKIGADNT